MCRDCWEDYGSPTIWSDGIVLTGRLIDALYSQGDATTGGPLHAFLANWNIDTDPTPHDIENFSLSTRVLAQSIAELMTAMTIEERASTLALQSGFWE